MLKYLTAVLSLVLLPASAFAASCADKKGEVIFEDNFADDSGGFSSDPDAHFDGELKLHFTDQFHSWVYWNNTFNVTVGNFCLEAVAPKAPAQDNYAAVGIAFLITDKDNYYEFQWVSDNTLQLWLDKNKQWIKIATYAKGVPTVPPGSTIVLDVTVNNGLIVSSFNGTQVGKLRAQIPQGDLRFGVYAELNKNVAEGYLFEFKNIKVTKVQ
jgi:hypothetical protein